MNHQSQREKDLEDNARALALQLAQAPTLVEIYDTAHKAVNRGDVRLRDAAELIQTYGGSLPYNPKR